MKKWDTINGNSIQIIGAPEGEEREKGADSLFKELMAKNFSVLEWDLDIQVHEVYRSQNKNAT